MGPVDVGRTLRNERIRQGLSHRDVSRRLGIPEDQLRAAEAGTLGPTDQLSALKTVRQYADLLGFPGDRYALAILENWPTTMPGAFAAPAAFREDPTAAIPLGGAAGTAEDDFFGAPFTPAAADYVVYDAPYDPRHGGAAFDPGEATGIVPAIPIQTTAEVVRRNPMPFGLRALAVILVVAVVAGGAFLAVDKIHPSWLRAVGLDRSTPTTAAGTGSGSTGTTSGSGAGAATSGTGSTSTSTAPSTTQPPAHKKHKTTGSSGAVVADAFHPRSTSGTTATLDTGSAPVKLTVSATGGPCWVNVTAPTSTSPLFTGVMAAGGRHTFTVDHGASVELGSSAGRISARSKAGILSTYQPPAAPFTLSLVAAGG